MQVTTPEGGESLAKCDLVCYGDHKDQGDDLEEVDVFKVKRHHQQPEKRGLKRKQNDTSLDQQQLKSGKKICLSAKTPLWTDSHLRLCGHFGKNIFGLRKGLLKLLYLS